MIENDKNASNESLKKTTRTPVECFSRNMGFIRPISYFNIGKRAEFEERNMFKELNCLTAGFRHQNLLKKAA